MNASIAINKLSHVSKKEWKSIWWLTRIDFRGKQSSRESVSEITKHFSKLEWHALDKAFFCLMQRERPIECGSNFYHQLAVGRLRPSISYEKAQDLLQKLSPQN